MVLNLVLNFRILKFSLNLVPRYGKEICSNYSCRGLESTAVVSGPNLELHVQLYSCSTVQLYTRMDHGTAVTICAVIPVEDDTRALATVPLIINEGSF
jgi:hypothetical protein